MKKGNVKEIIIALGIFLLVIIAIGAMNLYAAETYTTEDGNFEYIVLDDGTIEITGYTGTETEVTIPETIEGETVTSIGERAFFECSNLTGIGIPEGVTNIGSWAFYNCSSLTSINIPEGVTSIGSGAFQKCSGLINVTIPSSVIDTGGSSFAYCTNLTKVTIQSGVESIGNSCFRYCDNLKSIKIPATVTSIGICSLGDYPTNLTIYCELNSTALGYAKDNSINYVIFWDISKSEEDNVTAVLEENTLTISGTGEMKDWYYNNEHVEAWHSKIVNINKVIIEEGVTNIGARTFMKCANITNVKLPSTITKINSWAFSDCTNLQTIEINSYFWMDSVAFHNCDKLIKIIVGKDTKDFNAYLCTGITNLNEIEINSENIYLKCIDGIIYNYNMTELIACVPQKTGTVNIPYGVEKIRFGAFQKCENITEVIIPNSVIEIGEAAFHICTSLTEITIPGSVNIIPNNLVSGKGLERVIIEEGVEIIDYGAFQGCTSLSVIEIPSTISTIHSEAFISTPSITNFIVSENNNYFSSENGILYNKDKTKLIRYATGNMSELFTIPDNVKSLEQSCFYGANNLETVIFNDYIKEIPHQCFRSCENLVNVNISDSVTYIGHSAFRSCSSLQEIIIPENVTALGGAVFMYCNNLKTVEIKGNLLSMGNSVFSDCTNLENITIPQTLNTIGTNVFYGVKGPVNYYSNNQTMVNYVANSSDNTVFNAMEAKELDEIVVTKQPSKTTYKEGENFDEAGMVVTATYNDGTSSVVTNYTVIDGNSLTYEKTNVIVSYTENDVTKETTVVIEVQREHDMQATTCTEPAKCKECGYTEGEALGHTEVIDARVEPTCTQTGLTEGKHCSVCNEVLVAQEEIPATGHTEVIDARVEATCTETGLTEGKHCSVCNEELVAQEVVPAKGHTEVIDARVEATCTQTGLTEGKHCSGCNEVLVAQEVISAKGHTEVIDSKVEETCTGTGLTEGKHCSVCKEVLVAQEEIAALGHDYELKVISQTCTEQGYTMHQCKRCESGYLSTYTEALGHSFTNYTSNNDATCTEDGTETATCDREGCNEIDTRKDEGSAKGHTEVIDARVEPTCTQTGLTEGKHCSVCDEILVVQEEIPALEHNYQNGECTNCGEKSPEITIETEKHNIVDRMITKISPKTTIQNFKANIQTNAETIEIYNKNNELVQESQTVATGMKVKFELNGKQKEYTLVVTGDLNGDGKMSDVDLLRMARYKAGLDKTLSGAYLEAADVIKDNKPAENTDLLKLVRTLVGLDNL